MAKWTKAADCKSAIVGSNPTAACSKVSQRFPTVVEMRRTHPYAMTDRIPYVYPQRIMGLEKGRLPGNAAVIIAHNHPSGDPTPSPEDVAVTKQIVEAGKMMDIDVLDHVIIGQGRWVSLKERGLGFS